MAHSKVCCGMYRGKLYGQDLSDPNGNLLPFGNAEFTINQTMTEANVPNFESLGGNACQISYMESMQLALILHCLSPENLAIAFLGEAKTLTSDVVTEEEHVVNHEHALIKFKHVPDRTQAITVAAGATTYVVGKDYSLTNAGIVILEGTTIVMGSTISVGYTYGDNLRLDAAVISQKEFKVVFDGTNVGEAGQTPVVFEFHKVKFSPTDSFAVISGTDFANLPLTGEVLKDDSVVPTNGSNESQFFNVEWGQKASGAY